MPPRKSKRPTRGANESLEHYDDRLKRFEQGQRTSPASKKSSQPGIQKRARSVVSQQQKKQFQLTKNLTQQADDTLLDLTSSPARGTGAAQVFKTYSVSTYKDIVIDNPTRSSNFKPENTRGNRYQTLDEAIERYNLMIFPLTKFYQDSEGYWHSYVMYDDNAED